MRMYHPNLEPPHNECEVMTDRQAAVLADSGWLPAPEPETDSAAHVPTVRYAPDLRTDSEREADENAELGRRQVVARKRSKTDPDKGEDTTS